MDKQLSSYIIIRRPLVTEKSTHQQQTRNAYAFQVHHKANKPQIIDGLQKATADPDPTLSKAAREALGRIR